MLTLYRPGTGWLHTMPAGPKIVLVLAAVLAVSLLPSEWWAAAAAALAGVVAYAVAGLHDGMLGMRELGRQAFAVRWVVAFIVAGQLVFLGPEPAIANSARITAALLIAALLALTTRVTALLDSVERGLRPLSWFGIDAQRVALMLAVTVSTVPVLGGLAKDVRAAQRARGAGADLRTFVVPFLVIALKHADQLGDALTARGVR